MAVKHKALELADSAHLGYRVGWQRNAAAELRRLHAENAELLEALMRITSLAPDDSATEWNVALKEGAAAIRKATGGEE